MAGERTSRTVGDWLQRYGWAVGAALLLLMVVFVPASGAAHAVVGVLVLACLWWGVVHRSVRAFRDGARGDDD